MWATPESTIASSPTTTNSGTFGFRSWIFALVRTIIIHRLVGTENHTLTTCRHSLPWLPLVGEKKPNTDVGPMPGRRKFASSALKNYVEFRATSAQFLDRTTWNLCFAQTERLKLGEVHDRPKV